MKRLPKYRTVENKIRELIANGKYPADSCLPPEMDLARQLKVGRNTLLHAMDELVRDGVIVRMRGSGSYVARTGAAPLFPGRNLKIGILWSLSIDPERMLTDFHGMMTRGALSVLGLRDIQPQWPRTDDTDATRAVWTSRSQGLTVIALGESRVSRERHPPLNEVRNESFDGILSVSIIQNPWLDQLLRSDVPTVLADELNERFNLKADQVFADPQMGYRAAVRQLVAEGYKNIHFIAQLISIAAPSPEMSHEQVTEYRRTRGMQVDPDSYLRLSAYRQAMDECGLPARTEQIHFDSPLEIPNELLAERLIALPPDLRPDAIVCHGVHRADGLVTEFAKRGFRLRAACSHIGGYGGPAIPILANGEEMGAAAAELLISKLHRPSRLSLNVGVPMICKTPLQQKNRIQQESESSAGSSR